MKKLLACLVFCLLVGCEKKQAPDTLRIGINSWPGYEYLYLASELSLYQKHGLDVRIVEYTSLGDVRRAYERSQIDGMACTIIELLQTRALTNREPQTVLVADYSNGGDMILAREEITSVKALAGKTIGAEIASLNMFILARALQIHGLTLDDVAIKPMAQEDMHEAFSNNEVDAIVTYPPVSVKVGNEFLVNNIFSSKEIPGEVLDIVCIDRKVLVLRPDVTEKLRLVWKDVLAYARENTGAANAVMAAREGISENEFAEALGDLQIVGYEAQSAYFNKGGKLDRAISKCQGVMLSSGTLKKATDISNAVCYQAQ